MTKTGTKRLQNLKYDSVFKPPDAVLPPVMRWFSEKVRRRQPSQPFRFDDPDRKFAVTYSGSTLKACAVEVLDRFREDALAATLADAVRRKETDTFAYPLGSIPRSEFAGTLYCRENPDDETRCQSSGEALPTTIYAGMVKWPGRIQVVGFLMATACLIGVGLIDVNLTDRDTDNESHQTTSATLTDSMSTNSPSAFRSGFPEPAHTNFVDAGEAR